MEVNVRRALLYIAIANKIQHLKFYKELSENLRVLFFYQKNYSISKASNLLLYSEKTFGPCGSGKKTK